MTDTAFATATLWSYGLAFAGYLAFAARVALGFRKSVRAGLLLGALVATALWAGLSLALPSSASRLSVLAVDVANAARYASWFAFIAHLFARPNLALPGDRIPRKVIGAIGVLLAASVLFGSGFAISDALGVSARFGFLLDLGVVISGLILVEQIIRRVQPQQRWGIKPLALALAGVFGFDLFLYADAMLFGRLDADIWVARGFANVLVIPFIAIATARNSGWTIDLHISRKAVFHSSALVVSGSFLLVVAVAGYLVRFFGGSWGRALEIELVFAAVLFVAVVAASGSFRSRLKVFISKHFFSYRYDYREEWLRFTRTLSTENTLHGVQQRTIVAIADLVESPGGVLWLRDESRGYVVAARWNVPSVDGTERADGPLAGFLGRTGWIISVAEWRTNPARYDGLVMPSWLESLPSPWLIVPLASGDSLLGFVILDTPRTVVKVDWEVRDLLKTASRQAASYLGEIRATEALLEVGKFDAFNRMSAFVVHDLKNLVAQLSLMLKNAQRHRDNPTFQADMLSTVEHVVERMNALMLQLRTGTEPVENPVHVDLDSIVRRVCESKSDPRVRIEFESCGAGAAFGHQDRLEHVIGHLLQNAIDASPLHGRVSVRVGSEERYMVVLVSDDGAGMTSEFIRERLFRPFQTTKATGMGIGVYESAQYLARLGGDLQIDSAPGAGTRVRARLPRIDTAGSVEQPSAPKEQVA